MDAVTSHTEPLDAEAGTVTPLRGVAPGRGLPIALTSFVGRESELGQLREALRQARLVTLSGPGGCGKTRLALTLAADLVDRTSGGVWWVDLAWLPDPRRVGAAVAEALGVRPLPGQTELEAACAYLAARRGLVVLDNCEHLLAGCAGTVGALLKAAPAIVVLATSRSRLGVEGEAVWQVPPMSLPASAPSGGALAGSDAVALFVERARQARPAFTLSDGNAECVARVCAGVDGLPLAIELAAARVRMLSVEQIASGLGQRFRLLSGGPRTAAQRQQTLRASVQWSHELPSRDEQVLLRRLSVFAGGFTYEAAEEVCAFDAVERDRLLDLLASLVDQSLVLASEQSFVMRYRLQETMRQFARERLAEAGEEASLGRRHRDAFLGLAEQAGPHLETGRQREWLALLDAEAANLMTAIEHAVRTDVTRALRFCAALYRWWGARGRFAEAELIHSRVREACSDREPGLRARALHGRAFLAVWAGDFVAADAHATEALGLAEEAGDDTTAARARCQLGAALQFANPRASRAELARATALARRANDDWALATAKWLTVGTYMWQSDHAGAARANAELAELAMRQGDPMQVGRHWLYVTWMACFDGHFQEARQATAHLRAAVEPVGEPVMEALADHFMAFADVWQGEPARALEHQRASLERALTLGAGSVVPWLIYDVAFAELALGRPEHARDALGDMLPVVEGRIALGTAWALCLLAEVKRLLGDAAAEALAVHAQTTAERLGNRLFATSARLTLGRLAAAHGDWAVAQQHALAHLDACAEGGHMTYVPACLDALAEVASGLQRYVEATRLFAAAERARAQIGTVRVPAERRHWAAIDRRLRDALPDGAYAAARAEGAELSTEDALEWARRARGPRGRPPGGWESLTPTEARVLELATDGLSNRQIAERMFVSSETVKTHVAHIFKKIDVHSRAELVGRSLRRAATD
ncbi:MAG: helix-turn-helix transcriptional regulator [Solirubrobacteraceae bacterium]